MMTVYGSSNVDGLAALAAGVVGSILAYYCGAHPGLSRKRWPGEILITLAFVSGLSGVWHMVHMELQKESLATVGSGLYVVCVGAVMLGVAGERMAAYAIRQTTSSLSSSPRP